MTLNKKEATRSIKENIKDAKDVILMSDIEAHSKRPDPKSKQINRLFNLLNLDSLIEMSNDKHQRIDKTIKPDLIKKLNNNIVEMKNQNLQVEKMKKKIGEIISTNINQSILNSSNPNNFDDSISNSKKKFANFFGQAYKSNNFLETSRISNNKKDAINNTDKNLNLIGKL